MTDLRASFAVTHQKVIRGKALDYVSWAQVADRLDEAAPGWSFKIVQLGDDWCWGQLTLNGQTFENVGYAENAEADWKKEVLKDAVSDALKRCAALAGVARYLYDKDTPPPTGPRPPQSASEPPRRPELERRADGLVGTITKGSAPVDLQYRTEITPGPAFGFKLKAGKTGYQAVAIGELADALAIAQAAEDMEGITATVWGRIEMVPWQKDGKDMPPYARIAVERVQTPGWTLPAVPEGLFDG